MALTWVSWTSGVTGRLPVARRLGTRRENPRFVFAASESTGPSRWHSSSVVALAAATATAVAGRDRRTSRGNDDRPQRERRGNEEFGRNGEIQRERSGNSADF
ncbi:unnamed protein product, partial [Polarella glacialis]